MSARTEPLPTAARAYVAVTSTLGIAVLVLTLANWESPDLFKYGAFLLAAICTSGMRIAVPGITGTMPLTFVFVLLAVLDLSAAETILLGALVTVVQCYWNQPERPSLSEAIFQVSAMVVAITATERVYQAPVLLSHQVDPALRLAAATCTLFLFNTAALALPMAFEEHRRIAITWREGFFWSLPYYLGGAAVAKGASLLNHSIGWQTVLLTGPVVYLIYRSYRLYLDRLENEKHHAEEVSGLHLRTIEALALAIEAKDQTTHDHLQRVQVYAMELARLLGLSAAEQEALRAASILHDIGKLAVPDYIISKPGKLTPAEFERMKVHTVVGAEILEQVAFPYPVAPIVRSHHEKWDGTGYPDGLKAESIPIGARILSAVDCLDALASDRQYRRALPLDEAMDYVAGLSGRSFDPQVIEILKANYREFESIAQSTPLRVHKLSKDLIVSRGD
ncbi:MAG TPA: HD domain-containing phosphohydrolase, partial [Bryobacteraceae bacterium]|nr:HD domain-containing phosphohydrolase [Bryobacteraceae bacterium]